MKPREADLPAGPGKLHAPRHAAEILTLSLRTLQALTAAGKITPIAVSERRLAYSDAEIARYLATRATGRPAGRRSR